MKLYAYEEEVKIHDIHFEGEHIKSPSSHKCTIETPASFNSHQKETCSDIHHMPRMDLVKMEKEDSTNHSPDKVENPNHFESESSSPKEHRGEDKTSGNK